jgi:hypothetical protein
MLKRFPLVLLALAALASTSVHAQTRAPAPGLSSIRVYAVGSPNCGTEYTTGNMSTTCNHGGNRAVVLEFGYGVNPVAKMNGNVVSMVASTTVCGTTSNFTFNCSAGQTVIGFAYEYDLDGYQNGTFTYQNTSINAGGTLYTQINIL